MILQICLFICCFVRKDDGTYGVSKRISFFVVLVVVLVVVIHVNVHFRGLLALRAALNEDHRCAGKAAWVGLLIGGWR